ncbi:MAG: relaxase domain-containing protein, partial [Actinomycetota bacterium]|nr:relaxase domain-containing protein [Actinomycetota bacterium]
MLNIGRMAPGSHDYYLSVVADGAEDYYLRRGEAAGRWLGRGLDGVGLDGHVEAEQLRRVLAGGHPLTGERLASHPARRIPGFDLTFRAPKSVSLVWALSDREVADSVAAAHDAAVDAAIGYLERAAGFTRRGAGGAERVQAEGFVAAGFRHRTSRANDPLLHTHVLVANLAETVDDGVWRTLDSRALFAHAKTAGFLYQAHLRHELTRTLGVEWGPVVNGHADLAGVPRKWIDHFSRRRAEILRVLEARGESSAKAAQVATLETRQAKQRAASEVELRALWGARAREVGIDRTWPDTLLHVTTPRRPDVLGLYHGLVRNEGLTAHASTFTRRDVILAIAEGLPTGAPVETVEGLADSFIRRDPDQVVPLGITRGQLTALDTIRRADGTVVPAARASRATPPPGCCSPNSAPSTGQWHASMPGRPSSIPARRKRRSVGGACPTSRPPWSASSPPPGMAWSWWSARPGPARPTLST